MNAPEYVKAAMRTKNPSLTWQEQTEHAYLGLIGEAGEFAEAVKKALHQGHYRKPGNKDEIDLPALYAALRLELSDVCWSWAEAIDALGFDVAEVTLDPSFNYYRPDYPLARVALSLVNECCRTATELKDYAMFDRKVGKRDMYYTLANLWVYAQKTAVYLGSTIEEIFDLNDAKLRKRFPIEEGFTTDASLARVDVASKEQEV